MNRLWKKIILLVVIMGVISVSAHAERVVLKWDASTINVDGTCIDDHNYFTIHRGIVSETYIDQFDIPGTFNDTCINSGIDAGTGCGNIFNCTYAQTDVPAGSSFFALTSDDFSGNRSDYSNETMFIVEDKTEHNPATNFDVSQE